MNKNEFKDLLFDLLNEYGEQELGLVDIITYDNEDKFVIIESDGCKFEIHMRQLQ